MNENGPKTLIEAVTHFADLGECHAYMIRLKWPDGKITCPKCGGDKIGNIASRCMLQCKAAGCRKQFSAKVGTIFEDSPLGLDKWFVAVWCRANAKNGISSCELARALGIRQPSAWYLLHRLKVAMETQEFLLAEPHVEYRPIAGFPAYRVGSNGSVWSKFHGPWKFLHPTLNGHGYRCVSLRSESASRNVNVAGIVLAAFIGPRPDGKEARHLDGNRENNRLDNLAWGTPLENAADKRRHGTTARGQRQHLALLTDAQIAEIHRVKESVSRAELAERFCVPIRYIHRICRGQRQ
jgi:hypothetical protein